MELQLLRFIKMLREKEQSISVFGVRSVWSK